MNLVLDFGNTRIKAGLFKGKDNVEIFSFDTAENLLNHKIITGKIMSCMIASVTREHEFCFDVLKQKFPVFLFNSSTKIPLRNLYSSPETLGSDRILSSIGAFSFFPNQNVLTIDAGTCIKYNFVNHNNEFLGGAISPGIPMRLKAMHQFTSALPEVAANPDYDQLTGTNTKDSLLSGGQVGAAFEAEATIMHYHKVYPGLQVVITGGDAPYLCKQLKKPFFANPNCVLIGLYTTLLYQSEI